MAETGHLSEAIAAFREAVGAQEQAACAHAHAHGSDDEHTRAHGQSATTCAALLHEALAQLLDEAGEHGDALAAAAKAVEEAPQVCTHV